MTSSCCRLHCIDDALRKFFGWLGYQVGKRPGYFIIIPILLTALCASGFQRIYYEADPEYLFSPIDGEAKFERQALERHFPMDYKAFDPGRVSRAGRFGRLLIQASDNGSVLRDSVFKQISYVDRLVQNLSIVDDEGYGYRFEDLCAEVITGGCWQNEILGLGRNMAKIEAGDLPLSYRLWLDPDTFQTYKTFPFVMGGVKLDEDEFIEEVKIIALNYFLNSATSRDVKIGSKWEDAFLELMAAQDLPDIRIIRFSSLSMERELEKNTNSVIPYFSFNLAIMIGFCIFTCMMTDWVKSKPLLGLLGVASSVLATVAAMGLIMYCGIPFIGINMAAPFLMLGIGIDDTFVMLGAWRRTSIHAPVEDRMSEAFRDAAVSITITSVTDMLSFFVGVITPFPCVRIFCIYTGTSVIFTYIWHITLFGACMAVSGYAERQNRHALTCRVVVPKSLSKSRGFLYNVFCAGGVDKENPLNPKDNRENGVMAFFRDGVGPILNKAWFKTLVMLIFFGYLAVSAWGVTQLREGLERRKLSRYDSYSVTFYDTDDKYFREYPYRVNVVISGLYEYSSPEVQEGLERLLSELENTTYIDKFYTESWLREFLVYVKNQNQYNLESPIDISTEKSFIEELKKWLSYDSGMLSFDIDFSDDGQHIIGSRFLIQGWKIYNSNQEQIFLQEMRDVCKNSSFDVKVFHYFFIFFDQFLMVFPTTIQCVSVAVVIMMLVSLVLIPNPICSLWVAFSILSIEVGVVGFMTLWNVNLDSISMINLIMCIGFSVDFSAHISYHFMSRQNMPVKERVKDSMYALGMPITQGAITTILGVIGLGLAPSYIFVTFFKMVLLVIVLGALHGLILLPVLLSFLGPGSCCGAPQQHQLNSADKKVKKKPKQQHQVMAETQTYLEEAVEANVIRIPRPKHCSRHQIGNGHAEVVVKQQPLDNTNHAGGAGPKIAGTSFGAVAGSSGGGGGPAPPPITTIPNGTTSALHSNGVGSSSSQFHSDNYLQAATKNKKRSSREHRSRSSSSHNSRTKTTTGGTPPQRHNNIPNPPSNAPNNASSSKNGIYEMYTNRAFQD